MLPDARQFQREVAVGRLPRVHRRRGSTFGATGITTYLQNGGTIEHARQIANHPLKRTYGESPRTTKLYDCTNYAISLDERACPAVPGIERILI